MKRLIIEILNADRLSLFSLMALLTLQAVIVSPVQAEIVGEVVGSDTSTIRNPGISVADNSVSSAYTKPNQSRIWYNSSQDRWDALVPMFDDTQSNSQSDHYILKDVPGDQIYTSIALTTRDYARPDCFWDDDARKLYVLASHPVESRFWRVAYDVSTDRYTLEIGVIGAGTPVPGITHPNDAIGGNSPATLYVTPNANVWVAVMKHDGGLVVQHSPDGGITWMDLPVDLDVRARQGVTTWTHFVHNGITYAGLFAGENGMSGADSRFFFWAIDQNSDPTVLNNWINDPPPAAVGVEQADDHVSAARDGDGNIYFAVKTEDGNPQDPLIKLYKRTPAGHWSQFTVTTTDESPEGSRPSILIDEQNSEIYIFTNGAEVVGDQYRNGVSIKAGLASPENLASANIVKLFDGQSLGEIFTDIISPRHPVNGKSGIVVLAHNRTNETIWFSVENNDPGPDTKTVRDDFDTVSFSNNNGTLDWSGLWVERDRRGNGPAKGNIRITRGHLRLNNRFNSGSKPKIEREAFLSGYAKATLSIRYRTTAGVDKKDSVVLEVSGNGGTDWTLLENFVGISGRTTDIRSFDITEYIAKNTHIRIRVKKNYKGLRENFRVDFVEIALEK